MVSWTCSNGAACNIVGCDRDHPEVECDGCALCVDEPFAFDPDGESARIHMLIVRLTRARKIGDRLAIANIESLLGIRAADRVLA